MHKGVEYTDHGHPELESGLNALNGTTYLGDFGSKTVADLRSALDTWLDSAYNTSNASVIFSAGNDWVTLWNAENITSTISSGGRWSVTIVAQYKTSGYTQLRISTYADKAIYYVRKSASNWGMLCKAAFKDEIDALDTRLKTLEESGGSGGGSNVASDITITPIAGLNATQVQEALAEILSKIPNQVLPTVQSGSFTTSAVKSGETYTKTVTFDTPFASTPKVNASSSDSHFSPVISNITPVGFNVALKNTSSSTAYTTICTWNAYTT